MSNNQKAFLALVRAGLWEKEVYLSQFGRIDYKEIYRLAEEQSVVGLVAAGIEHVSDLKIPKEDVLQFVGNAMQLEQRNLAMNSFLGGIIKKMQRAGIYTLLVKGQGIAQCYERPLWRASGDIDLLLSEDNYQKAKNYLVPLSCSQKAEGRYSKHLGLGILDTPQGEVCKDQNVSWYVELHGSMRTGLSSRVDKVVDEVHRDLFYGGNVRSWYNKTTTVFLPSFNNDVYLVFIHYLMHFFKEGGANIRQLCDLCRLLWICRDKIDVELLNNRLYKAGLLNEWRVFSTISVCFLGMPQDVIPLFNKDNLYRNKANRSLFFIINCCKPRSLSGFIKIAMISPKNLIRFMPSIMFNINWLKIRERLAFHSNS